MREQQQKTQTTTQITIQGLIDSHNMLIGTQKVLNESLVPGHLSIELHNARVHVDEVIKATVNQIEQMKALGQVKNIKNAPKKQKS